jgi:hypothetical protein
MTRVHDKERRVLGVQMQSPGTMSPRRALGITAKCVYVNMIQLCCSVISSPGAEDGSDIASKSDFVIGIVILHS